MSVPATSSHHARSYSTYHVIAGPGVRLWLSEEALTVLSGLAGMVESRLSGFACGVLTGRCDPGETLEVRIENAIPENRKHLIGSDMIGYFRGGDGESLVPEEDEKARVILVIEASSRRTGLGCLYVRGQDDQWELMLEFPLRQTGTPRRIAPEAVVAPPRKKKREFLFPGWLRSRKAVWGGAAVLVALAGWSVWAVARQTGKIGGAGLGLTIERKDASLRIGWNRNSRAVANGASGVLDIWDGVDRRRVRLTPEHLKSGSVYYGRPGSKITARLEIQDRTGNNTAETVGHGTPVVVSAPQPPAEVGAQRQPVVPPAVAPAVSTAPGPVAARRAVAKPESPVPAARPPVTEPVTITHEQGGPELPSLRLEPVEQTASRVDVAPPPLPSSPTVREPPAARQRTSEAKPEPTRTAPPPVSAQVATLVREAPAPKSEPTPPPLAVSAPPPVIPAAAAPTVHTAPVPIRRANAVVPNNVRPLVIQDVSVDVQVRVDALGNVTNAVAVGTDSMLQRLLAAQAAQAARLWKFRPAQVNGRPVAGETTLRFHFARTPR